MIQLRRIRTTFPKGFPNGRSTENATSPNLTFESVAQLFSQLPDALEKIPPEERWNLYYTLGETTGDDRREWHGQEVIPFDIDNVVQDDGTFDEDLWLTTIFETLGVDADKCIVVASGNGLQILVQPPDKITDKKFFMKHRKSYERLCAELTTALENVGLSGFKVDPSSFAPNRVARLPFTENRKPGRPVRHARLLKGQLQPQDFHIRPPKGDPNDPAHTLEKHQLTDKQLSFFAIDTPSVEAGCEYLKWAKDNPADLDEPKWYALLSVVGRLEDGRQKCHAYSQGHPHYNERDTDRKIDQALAASGPRTCENSDGLWGNCHTCPHYKKVTSPVSIKSETFIATENSGFYLLAKGGGLQPQYEDLRRYFMREHPYKTHEKSGMVYLWDGTKYVTWSQTQLRNYAHEKFSPKPAEHVASEFCQWVNRTNLIEHEWFRDSTRGFINFRNGVYSLASGTLEAHSPAYGFLYTLPFSWEPEAACPNFDQFMRDISLGDEQLEKLLLEFVGYAICDQDYWLQKALLLIGEGSNGKSTFLKIVEELTGRENVSFLSLYDLQVETSRSHLEGKLLNISDELPNYNFKNTELLKKLLGGTMTMRKLYHDGIMIENSTKFIFAGNEIPSTNDVSEGLFRRLVIVPFNAKFKLGPGAEDAKAADVGLLGKVKAELPGVFNRVMRHYQSLKKRGHLATADRSSAELQRYRDEVDRVGSWVKDNLYWNGSWGEDKPFVEVATVFEKYVSDSKRSEERPLSKFHFTKHLRRHITSFDERYARQRVGQQRPYIIRGVNFKGDTGQKDHF
jgi:P4 family phage/plasmid primase-like protien